MTWVKLDDGFFDHPKAVAAGPLAVALFFASCCWSAANLTDGKVPKHVVKLIVSKSGVTKKQCDVLVSVGLWHDNGNHYEIHDYLHHNPSRSQVEKQRARWRRYKVESTVDSAVESNVEVTVESTVDSALSRPDPSRRWVNPPTGELRNGTLTGKAGDVLKLILASERQRSGPVRNRPAWEATVTERLLTEHGARIEQVATDFPSAPADVIAGYVLGESNNLRYYPRRESA
jgi:hypothetical protein